MPTITIEFGGGAELLFDRIKRHTVTLPDNDRTWSMRSLLAWMRDNMVRERPELFLQGETVRPGILVLVNDTDWELCGELDGVVADGDTILFISTLHGG